MIKNIAVFRNEYGSHNFLECGDDGSCWADGHSDYVRVTDAVEIDFPDLDPQAILNGALAQIAKAETKVRGQLQYQLDILERRRQELLALPMDVQPVIDDGIPF